MKLSTHCGESKSGIQTDRSSGRNSIENRFTNTFLKLKRWQESWRLSSDYARGHKYPNPYPVRPNSDTTVQWSSRNAYIQLRP